MGSNRDPSRMPAGVNETDLLTPAITMVEYRSINVSLPVGDGAVVVEEAGDVGLLVGGPGRPPTFKVRWKGPDAGHTDGADWLGRDAEVFLGEELRPRAVREQSLHASDRN